MSVIERAAAGRTDRGRRKQNEDAFLISELPGGKLLVALADGMGGHSAGEYASQQAVERLRDALVSGSSLLAAVAQVNASLHNEALANTGRAGMGTTLVALLAWQDEYLIANVGDSRAYRIGLDQGIKQITRDHSFLAEAAASGPEQAAEAAKSRWRNALTRAIATEADVEVDIFGPFPTSVDHAILLCSDGVYRVIDPVEMANDITAQPDLETTVTSLLGLAYDKSSDDNMTVVIVEFGKLARQGGNVTQKLITGRRTSRATIPVGRGDRWHAQWHWRGWKVTALLLAGFLLLALGFLGRSSMPGDGATENPPLSNEEPSAKNATPEEVGNETKPVLPSAELRTGTLEIIGKDSARVTIVSLVDSSDQRLLDKSAGRPLRIQDLPYGKYKLTITHPGVSLREYPVVINDSIVRFREPATTPGRPDVHR